MKKNSKVKSKLPNWNKKTKFEKIITVLSLIFCLIVIILGVLDVFNIWKIASLIYEPILALVFICETILYWKYDRKNAIVTLTCSIVVLLCYILLLIFLFI